MTQPPISYHLEILPTRDSLTTISKHLLSNIRLYDSAKENKKVTIDLTHGLEPGLTPSDFTSTLVETITDHLSGDWDLILLHRDPEAGRQAAAVAMHDAVLKALGNAFVAGLWSRKGVRSLTIKGVSCSSGLHDFLEWVGQGVRELTLEDITLTERDLKKLFEEDEVFELILGLEVFTLRGVRRLEKGETHETAGDAVGTPLLERLRERLPKAYNMLIPKAVFAGEGGEESALRLYPQENVVVVTSREGIEAVSGGCGEMACLF